MWIFLYLTQLSWGAVFNLLAERLHAVGLWHQQVLCEHMLGRTRFNHMLYGLRVTGWLSRVVSRKPSRMKAWIKSCVTELRLAHTFSQHNQPVKARCGTNKISCVEKSSSQDSQEEIWWYVNFLKTSRKAFLPNIDTLQ